MGVRRSVSTLGLYERNELSPPTVVLERLAEVLRCRIEDFFDEVPTAEESDLGWG